MEWAMAGEAFRHYQAMSNELGRSTILVCPCDSQREQAANSEDLSNTNISYFLGLLPTNAVNKAVLIGDRNLALIQPIPAGVYGLTSNMNPTFTAMLHKSGGNVVLADISAQQVASSNLSRVFLKSGLRTNWVAVP